MGKSDGSGKRDETEENEKDKDKEVKMALISIEPSLLQKYKLMLNQKNIAVEKQPYFIKWLQYYLDFCQKYNFNKSNPKSLPLPFTHK